MAWGKNIVIRVLALLLVVNSSGLAVAAMPSQKSCCPTEGSDMLEQRQMAPTPSANTQTVGSDDHSSHTMMTDESVSVPAFSAHTHHAMNNVADGNTDGDGDGDREAPDHCACKTGSCLAILCSAAGSHGSLSVSPALSLDTGAFSGSFARACYNGLVSSRAQEPPYKPPQV